MKKVFSILSIALIFAVMGNFNNSASASSEENLGVSTQPPVLEDEAGGVTPYGTDTPSKSNVVDLTVKPLPFKGTAKYNTLFTNSHFKGKTTPSYQITNKSSSTLLVTVREKNILSDTIVDRITLPPFSSGGGTIFNLNPNKLYYLSFSAPSDFTGSVY